MTVESNDWTKKLALSKRGTPMHTAIGEVIRLRKEIEGLRDRQLDSLRRDEIVDEDSLYKSVGWLSRQKYGESVSEFYTARALTRILEGETE